MNNPVSVTSVSSRVPEQSIETPAEQQAWALLMAARAFTDERLPLLWTDKSRWQSTIGFEWRPAEQAVISLSGDGSNGDITVSEHGGWRFSSRLAEQTQHLLELYLPVLGTPGQPRVVIGHLGQSVDAKIATRSGDAFFVTGEENRKHLHRLRALCQAVLVGAGTVLADDPQLTTRAVSGASPVRVIIDPKARLPQGLKILEDGQAATWLLHDSETDTSHCHTPPGCRRIAVPMEKGSLQPRTIIEVLAQNGIRRVFVEGGGLTVSRFFNARCLHRLQVATAPLLVGEGVPSLQIPGALSMLDALRPAYRVYRMGQDVMWDFDLNESLWSSGREQPRSLGMASGPALSLLWRAE